MAASFKLVASLICHDEMGRYLPLVIADLQTYCDEIRVVDDGSTDGSFEWLSAQERVEAMQFPTPRFYLHEGQARQACIDWSFKSKGTHYLSIDCDEVCSDGRSLRALIEAEPEVRVWSLQMEEAWLADENYVYIRIDGGWRTHPLPVLWKAPPRGSRWTMRDRKLACGRVPEQVWQQGGRAKASGEQVMHFGWADPSTRRARYDRYATHDGGRFHASRHLQSILWDDRRVKIRQRQWPDGPVFDGLRERFAAVDA